MHPTPPRDTSPGRWRIHRLCADIGDTARQAPFRHARRAMRRASRASPMTPAVCVLWLCVASVLPGCERSPTAPTPTLDPSLQVTPIDSAGPIRLTFVNANISPGSSLVGCGPLIEGCAGRVRMTFLLAPTLDGPVLYARMYLHATNLLACLWGETEPFSVRAGFPMTIEIAGDRADRCATPTTITTMALVVEGPIQVSSRQTWSLRYAFAP